MVARLADYLDRQPPARRRLYSVLIAISLLTLPCYLLGFVLLAFSTASPVAPDQNLPTTAAPAPTFTAMPAAPPTAIERATREPELQWTATLELAAPTATGTESPTLTPAIATPTLAASATLVPGSPTPPPASPAPATTVAPSETAPPTTEPTSTSMPPTPENTAPAPPTAAPSDVPPPPTGGTT
jgi:hypothetical protein